MHSLTRMHVPFAEADGSNEPKLKHIYAEAPCKEPAYCVN